MDTGFLLMELTGLAGATLITLIGIVFILIVRVALKSIPRSNLVIQPASFGADLIEDHGASVMVVEGGGRIRSMNSRARQVFRLEDGEAPNLERLARKVRPSEIFLQLCSNEGQARFVLEGRLVEGTSYLFTSQNQTAALVSLRYPEITSGLSNRQGGINTKSLQSITQLTQAMAASLDLNETLRAILENVEKLLPADFMEVTLWDAESQTFTPFRFAGLPGVSRKIERSSEPYSTERGFTGILYKERKPLLIPNAEARQDLKPGAVSLVGPIRSYLGLPLMDGTEFLGTLELASMTPDAFGDDDLDLVLLLSGQAAIAVHNALLYTAEQKRTAELSGLAYLAQAVSSVRDPGSLYARLVESIRLILPVEMLGFLIYNENQRILEAKTPFQGLPDPFVEMYRAQVLPGSYVEQALLAHETLVTEDASEDERWAALEFDHLAQAASMRETALVPLTVGGHMMGYLQVSNHAGGRAPFTQSEIHLLTIVANQCASIIENASLVQQSRQRAQRAEALRRVASLVSSAANLEEILQFSIQELARLLHAEAGAVFLIDLERGILNLHRSSVFGSLAELPDRSVQLIIDDPQFHFTVTGSQRILTLGDLLNIGGGVKAIVPFYQSILDEWGIKSLIAVPLVVRSEGIGELWFASRDPDFFDQGDAQVVATAAGQLAGVVEQSFLRNQTDDSLRRRVEQMTAITRISRELSTSLDLNYLLNLVYDESLRTTRADCGTILLFDLEADRSGPPSVRLFFGDAPGDQLSPLENQVLEKDIPLNIHDFSRSEFEPPHPGIQSALVVPISYQRRDAGLICLHGKLAGQFDQTAVEISQSLAIQAAVALNNALAFEEQTRRGALLKRELETLSRLIEVSRTLKPNQSLQKSLNAIAQAVQAATPFQYVVISIFDPESQLLTRLVNAGVPPAVWDEMRTHSQPWRSVQQLMQPQFNIGEAYYIPENKKPPIPQDIHLVNIQPSEGIDSEDAWGSGDILLIPMHDAGQNPLGLISVDAPSDHQRPDRPTFEALEVFAAQASMVIESHQRNGHLERQLGDLQSEKARLEQAAGQAQKNLPVMLHKDLAQSIALRGLNQRIERIRASLEIASVANRQISVGDMLHTLGSEMLTRFSMQVALIAEATPTGAHLLEVIGDFPPGAIPEALFGQRNPLRHMLQQRRRSIESALILISNLEGSQEWQNNNMINVLEARSMIGLPLDMGRGRSIGVLVLGSQAMPAFLDEDRRVFAQLAYQVSVGLQNLELLNETRRRLQEVNQLLDFSRKLASLQSEDILSSLIESVAQALSSAHAGWVGLWEEKELSILPQAAVGYASQPDILGIRYRLQSAAGADEPGTALPLRVFRTGRSERIREVDFAEHYLLSPDDLLRYRAATNGRIPLSIMLIPLRIGENVLGVVFLENFDTLDAFSEEDEALVSSFTRQAAMALENARLYQASEQRASQLQALTKVAGTITSSLQRDELISSLLDQLKQVLPYETATLWLRSGSQISVSAASGFADNEMRLNISVAVEDSALFTAMIRTGEPVSVGDIRSDARFPSFDEPENFSWLGIPLIYKSEVIGLIALEKREPDFYSPDHINAGTAFASQAAVSLENARLYEESTRRAAELDERSQRMALLNRLSSDLAASLDIDHIFRLTGQQMCSALNASGAAAVMIDEQEKYILQAEVPEQPDLNERQQLESPLLDHLRQSQGIYQTGNVAEKKDLFWPMKAFIEARAVQSMLIVPLVTGSALQGWFLIYGNNENRYTLPELELARTMCNQAATAVQNARLFAETHRLTEDLERRVESRTHELRREHHNSQTMLKIITELSSSLDMDLVLNRTLSVLNESTGSEESLIILAQGSAKQYRAGIQLSSAAGEGSSARNPVERQIARWVDRTRQPVLVERVQEDGRWELNPNAPLGYQSVVGVPLVMGEEVLGTLLLVHRQPGFFSQVQMDLLEATARQIGIALNNAELFNLIRDQSEHLGSMLREQQIEASRSRAILEAVADGVLVTDSQNRVTLFNVSAERILGLSSRQVIGRSLDHFSGLFSNSGVDWLETIRRWSQSPDGSRGTESFAEQIELDNGRIVAVHLAPVFWRQGFLGTVSIFRDITHEIQVDRLKSEFVANVSHELRTPMTSVKGYVEIMLMGAAGELNPQQAHFLKIVKSNTERLMVLVNDLLDISRIESGRVSLSVQPLDLRVIAKEVIADLKKRSQDENRPMMFSLEAQEGMSLAEGDMERVRQIVNNLVCNGYLYTPDNGCVTVKIQEVGQEIQVDVIDNGIGIAPELQNRIFERFYRGEDSLVLASAGTGLGLAIARSLVEMHHGRIWFSSSGVPGEGSIFSFTLPVHQNYES